MSVTNAEQKAIEILLRKWDNVYNNPEMGYMNLSSVIEPIDDDYAMIYYTTGTALATFKIVPIRFYKQYNRIMNLDMTETSMRLFSEWKRRIYNWGHSDKI